MPSPLGHALGGLAAGWIASSATRNRSRVLDAGWFAAAGMAADLDLLVGAHSGPTHSVGATAIVGLLAYLMTRRRSFSLAVSAAYASHIVLDWLGSDRAPPIGIMALWPLSRDYHESSLHVFHAVSRRYWQPDFWALNMHAVAREVIVLGPIAALIFWWRSRHAN